MAPGADRPAGDALGIRRVEGRPVDPRADGVVRAQEALGADGDAPLAPFLQDVRAGHDALRRAHLTHAPRPGPASRVSRARFAIRDAVRARAPVRGLHSGLQSVGRTGDRATAGTDPRGLA